MQGGLLFLVGQGRGLVEVQDGGVFVKYRALIKELGLRK
jgi:hypothetical protein